MARLLRYGSALVAALACAPSQDLGTSRIGPVTRDSGLGGALNGRDSGGRATSVRVVLGEASVCPGQCTDVRAVVDGPGDYRYSWTPRLPAGAGPHTLCPSETTRIEVGVVSASGEFSSDPVVAAATLEVLADCRDAASGAGGTPNGSGGTPNGSGGTPNGGTPNASGGATQGPADAGLDASDADAPPPAAFPLVEPSCVTHLVSGGGMQVLDMGGDDSAYVVGMFKGALSAEGVTLTSSASVADGFVVRVDSGCRVVWARSLPGASRTLAYQVATDPDGQVVVAGSFDGFVDFGAGLLLSAPFRNVFVAKLDRTDGHVIWNRQYPTTEIPGSNQGFTSLAVAANGDIAFTGFGNRATDFGGGALAPPDASAEVTYAAKLDSVGGYRFSRPLPFSSVSSALLPDGTMSVAGIGYGTFTWGARQVGAAAAPTDVVAQLDVQGVAQGISVRPCTTENWQLDDGSEGLAAASDGTLYRAEGRLVTQDVFGYATVIWSPGAAAPVVGEVTLEYSTAGLYDAHHRLSVDGSGALFAASQYGGDEPVAGRMLTPLGARDAIVLRLDRAGAVDWGGRYGTPNDEWDVHVHATPSRGVFIAGFEGGGVSGAFPGAFVAQFNP